MSDRLRLAVLGVVTAACLAAALWGSDLRAVAEAVVAVRPGGLLVALAFSLGVFALRVARFGLLLGSARPPMVDVASASGVGFLALQLLPLRLGELVRPYLLARRGVPFARSLGAIGVERLMDLLVLIGMLAAVGQVDLPSRLEVGGVDVLGAGQRAASVGAAILVVALGTVVALGGRADAWLARLPLVGPRLSGVVGAAADAVRGLGAPRAALAALASVAIWACNVGTVLSLLDAQPGLPARPEVALTVATATLAGVLAVPTPGMVGAFELSATRSLALWPVPVEAATAFALVWHALVLGMHAVLGAALLVREGTSLAGVVRASRSGAPTG